MTKEEARAFIRKVMGPERRTIEGDEKEHFQIERPYRAAWTERRGSSFIAKNKT